MGADAMILVFWTLSFKAAFSHSSFIFIKKLFSSSSFPAIMVVSSVHRSLMIFLPRILIPAGASSSLAFHMMCSAYKLNKLGDNIQSWCTPSPILNQSVVPCPVLTDASWPAYRFLRRQVRWSGVPISWRTFHSLLWSIQSRLWHSQWSRSRCFSEILLFFQWSMDVGNLISGFSAFSKSNLDIWKFTVHVMLKPSLENFEYYFTSVWDERNCAVVWAFFGIAFH